MLKRFGMPPDVTRRQTRRDLLLIIDAAEEGLFTRGDGSEFPDQ